MKDNAGNELTLAPIAVAKQGRFPHASRPRLLCYTILLRINLLQLAWTDDLDETMIP